MKRVRRQHSAECQRGDESAGLLLGPVDLREREVDA